MHKNLKRSRDIAYLRQLCCSGLDKNLVLYEFYKAVKPVLPSDSNSFSYIDKETLRLKEHILEHVTDEVSKLIGEIHPAYWTQRRIIKAGSWLAEHNVITSPLVFDEYFYTSEMYQLLLKPMNQHHALCAAATYFGKPIGMVTLFRPKKQRPFDNEEIQVFINLMTYVAHALRKL